MLGKALKIKTFEDFIASAEKKLQEANYTSHYRIFLKYELVDCLKTFSSEDIKYQNRLFEWVEDERERAFHIWNELFDFDPLAYYLSGKRLPEVLYGSDMDQRDVRDSGIHASYMGVVSLIEEKERLKSSDPVVGFLGFVFCFYCCRSCFC